MEKYPEKLPNEFLVLFYQPFVVVLMIEIMAGESIQLLSCFVKKKSCVLV